MTQLLKPPTKPWASHRSRARKAMLERFAAAAKQEQLAQGVPVGIVEQTHRACPSCSQVIPVVARRCGFCYHVMT